MNRPGARERRTSDDERRAARLERKDGDRRVRRRRWAHGEVDRGRRLSQVDSPGQAAFAPARDELRERACFVVDGGSVATMPMEDRRLHSHQHQREAYHQSVPPRRPIHRRSQYSTAPARERTPLPFRLLEFPATLSTMSYRIEYGTGTSGRWTKQSPTSREARPLRTGPSESATRCTADRPHVHRLS
jgi:hypothetical protein